MPTTIVALIAPAGYGKSLAAAELTRAWGMPTAWLSADARDSDAVTLVRGVAAAIAAAVPVPDGVIDAVADPGASPWSVAIPTLVAALADAPPMTIAIDDVDRIAEDEAIDVVLSLARALDGRGRLVLTGRSLGRLPGPRLQASGAMAVLGREDLALDRIEVGRILRAAGVDDPDRGSDAVLERTEGWAAGVYLSTLVTTGRSAADPEHERAPASPTAPERLVEAYVRDEILASMGPEDVDLLSWTSMLDRLSGSLCDAVLERTGSGAALDRLERTNLFLIPLDEERTWYRPHHLISEVLRADLERVDPDRIADVDRRAAMWHADHGLTEEALEYAMRAGDEELAARLLPEIAQETLNAGRHETVRRWFSWFDGRPIAQRQPRFASLATIMFSLDGDAPRAERWAAIDDAITMVDDRGIGARAIARGCLWRGDLADTLTETTTAVRTVADDDPLRTAALVAHGVALSVAGDDDAALETFAAAIAAWERRPSTNVALVFGLVGRAAIRLAGGDRAAAEADIRRARHTLVGNGLVEQPIAAAVDAMEARLAMAHGAIGPARRAVSHAQRLRASTGPALPWIALRARLDLIRALLAMDDPGGARTILAEIHALLEQRPHLGVLVDEARELEARIVAARGGVAGASTLTMAELRLLPLLTTHLTFREIGDRLFVSQNTVKTQAISIYRKLDATSRSEAIARATELGLLGPAPGDGFIRAG